MATVFGNGQSYVPGTAGNDFIKLNQPGHADGGNGSDNINGSSGNDLIQGGRGTDFMYGGAGNDTFRWLGAEHRTQDEGTYDRVFDFEGAGVSGGDLLEFRNFGVGSTFEVESQIKNQDSSITYKYVLFDSASGISQDIFVNSVNGKALIEGKDFNFYGSIPAGDFA